MEIAQQKASTALRFVNFVVDVLISQVVSTLVIEVVNINFIQSLATNLAMYNTESDYWPLASEWVTILGLPLRIALLFFYYFAFEVILKKTPAKFLTDTRVIMCNGLEPNAIAILKRTLVRFIPFEVFSRRNETWWHDRWANTLVIKEIKDE